VNIIQNLVKLKKDKKNIALLGIYLPDLKNSKNKELKPIITGVDEAGPSHDVIKENDLILKINKKKINNLKDYENALKKLKPNEIIIIRVKRRNQELNRAIRTISLHELENPKQKHFVRFDLYFYEGSMDTKILAVGKKSVANKKIKSGDVILEINKEPIFNGSDYLKEIKKVLWGEKVLFTILRDKKKIYRKIKSNSFYEYKLRTVMFDVRTKLFNKKYLKVVKTQPLYSEGNLIKKGDIILSISATVQGKQFKKKLIDDNDLFRTVAENFEPTQRINFHIIRKKEKKIIEIKLENYFDFLKKNEDLTRGSFLTKPQADFMLKEYENGSYQGLSDELRFKISKMDLEEEVYVNEYYEKLYISTSVKKEKVSGKDSFVVYFDSFPNTYGFEENSVFLKVYAFDVTDLDQKEYENIYYETDDYEDNPKLDNYLRDNCNVIKTNNLDWGEGSSILVQKKLLDPNEDPPEKIAFPFSVMNFPKAGKRKIAFRSFICKKELKFHENEGRPLDYQMVNYRPEHFKLNEYQDHFDEYDSYPDILAYDATEIDAEYKQAGYLGVNRQKLDTLIIPIGYAIANIKNDPSKSIQLVKDEIAFKGDRSTEGGINQVLNLKKTYDQAQISKIDPQDYLNEIKNYSKIDERYEVINSLLNIATNDKTLSLEENKFLDEAAKKLELNQNKYLEIKKIETASLKFVDFGDKADESIFGISNEMDVKEKCKILRQEYSRWNSQTNNTDKNKRIRAKEMVNLIANLRKQYSC
jgi:hypothetical protein